jgi:hypothetical protein
LLSQNGTIFCHGGGNKCFLVPGRGPTEVIRDGYFILYNQRFAGNVGLKRHDPVNTICPEDAELPLVVTAKVDETAATLPGAG